MNQRSFPLWAVALALVIPASAAAQYPHDHPHPDPGLHRSASSVLQIPRGTRVVDASGMRHVTQVGFVPASVEVLILRGTRVQVLPNLPRGLRVLNISRTPIRHVPWLPNGLRELQARGSQLRQIGYLPNGLQTLDVSGSPIAQLPNLPTTLSSLDVSRTPMRGLPPLPSALIELNIRGSHIQLGYVPASVRQLDGQSTYASSPPRRQRWSREWRQRRQRRRSRATVRVRRPDGDYRRSRGYENVWDTGWERSRRQRAY